MASSSVNQKDNVSYNVMINGLEVNAVYSRDSIEGIFLPLLRKLTKMQKEKGRRVLVLLAAPPGAGKSTLLSFMEKLASEDEQSGEIQIIGMDGFHRRQAYLVSHTVIRDGEEMPMSRIKGYLLLDEPGWRELKDLADYTVLIRADEELLRTRLTDRKAMGMATREEAEKFVEFSDMRNVRTCLDHSGDADLMLEMTGDGEYRIVV